MLSDNDNNFYFIAHDNCCNSIYSFLNHHKTIVNPYQKRRLHVEQTRNMEFGIKFKNMEIVCFICNYELAKWLTK